MRLSRVDRRSTAQAIGDRRTFEGRYPSAIRASALRASRENVRERRPQPIQLTPPHNCQHCPRAGTLESDSADGMNQQREREIALPLLIWLIFQNRAVSLAASVLFRVTSGLSSRDRPRKVLSVKC